METIQKSKLLIFFAEYQNFSLNVSTPLFRIILTVTKFQHHKALNL